MRIFLFLPQEACAMINTDLLYTFYLQHPEICTDTRKITSDCLFFALKGDNFDANTFAAQALEQGAAYAVIDNIEYQVNERCILVEDVLAALQELARHHRTQLHIPVIGLTGSNGKTTTKELIYALLATKYKTYATHGNLNNHIGVPLTILGISNDIEIAIIEMGANHQHEIEMLCGIAQPTYGLITNIGMAHLDGFGGFEGVKKGKAELYAYIKENDGEAFVYRDNPILMEMSTTAALNKIVYYGKDTDNRISGQLLKSDPFLELSWREDEKQHTAKTNLTGTYNFENILGAICIGSHFGLSPQQINAGLLGYTPKNNRSQLSETANNKVICDFYNANPSSMAAALHNLAALTAEKKTAIIGDMFELGSESAGQHKEIAELASSLSFDEVIYIGDDFYAFKADHPGKFFQTRLEAQEYIAAHPPKGELILLKGSRGMALEKLLPLL
jgi:UDP-N-acetylmuramoyl-tripeptide--D-alanyl-D-alanine ligase